MPQINGDALRGHLETLILSALRRGEAHGFEILHRLEAAGSGALQLKEGSLYPALYRMESAGLIKGAWEPQRKQSVAAASTRRGPRRRTYALTQKGRRKLESARADFDHFVTVIGGILGVTT
jgi:PadR family transcriptional regulator, regulatory protein PadR